MPLASQKETGERATRPRSALALLLFLLLLALPASAQPDWPRHAVWYQIFPERFRNGDPGNDPRLEDTVGSWPHDHTSPWRLHPWTSDWYELQPYEKENGKDIWFNLQRRRYGGDLQGVMDELDYLQHLGVNALYLNPIFAAPSQHKYDATLYHHVDPTFGPDPEGDRRLIAREDPADPATWPWTSADLLALKLIEECHRRRIHVIFDGVFNHIGQTSPFFEDVVKNKERSPYKDWFIIKSFHPEFVYQGWFGVKELPEWREDANGIVTGPRDYIFAVTKRWMRPEGHEGIDGWRLDVAFCVAHPFWKDWSRLVRSLNPDAYLTAEVIDSVEANKPFLRGDEFDAVMNYNFAFAASEFFLEGGTAEDLDRKLAMLRHAYPPRVAFAMQNLYDSHDTARLASNIVNRGLVSYRDWPRYCEASKGSNPAWNTRAPDAKARKIQKLMAVLQMTYVGAPMIYYGDETGMWGANDPDCRKPMVWSDLSYSPEATNPDQTPRIPPDPVAFDPDMFGHYQRLIAIRRSNPGFETNDFRALLARDGHYAYARGDNLIVALNNTDRPCTLPLPAGRGAVYYDLLQTPAAPVTLQVKLAARGAAILRRSGQSDSK